MFYDPMECKPFYQDNDNPIWYGRVENMQKLNQKILVYGFVTQNLKTARLNKRAAEKELNLQYSMKMRGKNSDEEEWDYLNKDEPYTSYTFDCDSLDSEICTYFPVGFVWQIDYEMYDVAVEVFPDDTLASMDDISINFHIAYVNPQFTLYQLYCRTFFTCISMLILCTYCTKLCCRIPAKLQS